MTTQTFTVEVPYLKTVRPPVTLNYAMSPLGMNQARFNGRLVATPQIDLSAFSCRAVVDFVEVKVWLSRTTQFRFVQDQIVDLTGRTPWVRGADQRSETLFTIRIQDPDPTIVEQCLAGLRDHFGFEREPEVHMLEVSVDFTPREPSELRRHRMIGVLTRHLYPDVDFLSDRLSRPLMRWGKAGDKKMRHLVGDSPHNDFGHLLRWPVSDAQPAADATLYVGAQLGRAQWKIMDKIFNDQNHRAGIKVALDDKEKRARVEVTLNREELGSLGIGSLGSLWGFRFAKMQGRYFQFVLPTFGRSSSRVKPAVAAVFDESRRTRFRTSGVLGLVIMDKAYKRFHADNRKSVAKTIRTLGLKIARAERVGAGSMMTFVKYEELNGRVSSALEKLGERTRRG